MNYYLVDYENVGADGLKGIEALDEQNTVYVFYSNNADKITFELHMKLNASKAAIFFFKANTGHKNALDFQLSSYLGWLIHANSGTESKYFIVSKDNGFSSLIPFWKRHKAAVSMVADVSRQNINEAEENLTLQVQKLAVDEKNAAAIASIILSYKTKQGINNALVKAFGTQKAGEIYKAVKPLLTDKKGR